MRIQLNVTPQLRYGKPNSGLVSTNAYGVSTPQATQRFGTKKLPPQTPEERILSENTSGPEVPGHEQFKANVSSFFEDPMSTFRAMVQPLTPESSDAERAVQGGVQSYLNGEVEPAKPNGAIEWLQKRQTGLQTARAEAANTKTPNGAQQWLLNNVSPKGNVIPKTPNGNHEFLKKRGKL
ncbi:MAG: hypothetical protein ACKO37_05380 [Vampirovibrionales bacterium]